MILPISITDVYSMNLSRAKVHLVSGLLWSIADYVFTSRSLLQIFTGWRRKYLNHFYFCEWITHRIVYRIPHITKSQCQTVRALAKFWFSWWSHFSSWYLIYSFLKTVLLQISSQSAGPQLYESCFLMYRVFVLAFLNHFAVLCLCISLFHQCYPSLTNQKWP